jgi:hypothetical protein
MASYVICESMSMLIFNWLLTVNLLFYRDLTNFITMVLVCGYTSIDF